MDIKRAKEIGFCFGVRRAIDLLEKAAQEHGFVETLGATVHNRVVIEKLERKGVKIVGDLDAVTGGTIAVSSHGIGPRIMEDIRRRHLRVIDATCPRVRYAQRMARDLAKSGFYVIVFGDAHHPEVQGVLDWAEGAGSACLDEREVTRFDSRPTRVGILSQTTQSHQNFACFAGKILAEFMPRIKEIRMINTICEATRRRQTSAIELSRRCDAMLVVGGHASSNTRRLAEVCTAVGVPVHLVETAAEVETVWVQEGSRIGVTAGTSTPDETIEEVVVKLKSLAGGEAA